MMNVLRRIIREQERRRLGIELHDGVGQVLALANLQLRRLERRLAKHHITSLTALLQETVDTLIPQIETALKQVQEASFDLQTPGLVEVGLAGALEMECTSFQRRTGTSCNHEFESLRLDPEDEILIVIMLREILTNIARHAGATMVHSRLRKYEGFGILDVQDNGRGIQPSQIAEPESLGIRGLQERARLLEGTLTIDGRANEGTSISLTFPVRTHLTILSSH
jgi:signal transduction histidine kinase